MSLVPNLSVVLRIHILSHETCMCLRLGVSGEIYGEIVNRDREGRAPRMAGTHKSEEDIDIAPTHTHAHARHVLALLATRTTCTTRASPVRSRCRRARPCGSRPAAAADPTPRRPSGRASPPRRPTPAPRSSTCVESKAARASAGWLFGGGLQRQSVPQAAPKRANPRGASTTALLTTTALDHGPALHQGPAPRPCTMARLST